SIGRREFQSYRLPVRIEDEIDAHASVGQLGAEGDAVRLVAPIRPVELHSMPTSHSLADQLNQSHPRAFRVSVAQPSRGDERLCKPMKVRMFHYQRPVEPTGFVVLTIRVVVAELSPPGLVSHDEHGQTHREQRGRHEILHLTVAKSLDFGITGWPLDTTIPAA